MNHEGGTLVVGVTDEGSVVGVEPDIKSLHKKPTQDGLALHLTEILTKYLGASDAAMVGMSFASIDDKTVVVLSADPALTPDLRRQRGAPQSSTCDRAPQRVSSNVKEATDYIAAHWTDAA